jgi:hypothetical protein
MTTLEERVANLEEALKPILKSLEDPHVINQFEIVKKTITMSEAEGPAKHVEVEFTRPVKQAYAFMQGWNLTWGDHDGQPLHTAQVFCNDAEVRAYDPKKVSFTVNLWMTEHDQHQKEEHGGWKGVFFIGILGVVS